MFRVVCDKIMLVKVKLRSIQLVRPALACNAENGDKNADMDCGNVFDGEKEDVMKT